MSRTWERLAEAVGIETEAGFNYRKAGQRANMQRYGSVSRQAFDRSGPMPYFKPGGGGLAQGNRAPTGAAVPTGRPMQIPGGTDRPTGQPNPLTVPTRAPTPLSRSGNAPRGTQPVPTPGGEEEDEGAYESAGVDEESRFKRLSHKLGRNPKVRDPDALAASIGRKKYGAKKFASMGRK